ncbi:actin cortical patch protein [Niveomyces insectorum RCEF 264]|uniref:Actin cortical patch protein n=1 Tax=Niveomyces insectorum RCEF 264 TaxID=1081102 RepID=A0A167ULB3_9HYPO|nr:actin cortical patch protein [Niveomyces insectorum RCEF 264]
MPSLFRIPLGFTSNLLLATSLLFLFFIILSGVTNHTPLNRTYFLQADTTGITGAHPVTQWTYFYACGEGNTDCGSAHPAMPFGKAWAADPANAPSDLVGKYGGHTTSHYYYYMWRFGWVFFLLALLFNVLAFFTSFVSCFRIGSGISSLLAMIALVCLSVAVPLMTATFVKARNAFRRSGRSARLGRYAFGFSWAAWTALFLATILLCCGIRKGGSGRRRDDSAYINGSGAAAGTGAGVGPRAGAGAASPSWRNGWRRSGRRNRAGSFSKTNYADGGLDNVNV